MYILNIGSLNVDKVYGVEEFVRAGETIAATSLNTYCGGKGLNQSVALSRAGASVRHAGLVGFDGQIILDELTKNEINTSLIKMIDEPTGVAIIQVNAAGENSIIVYGGANKKIDETYIDYALEGTTSGSMLVLQNEISNVPYAILRAKERGMKIALTPAPVTKELLSYPIELVDYLLLNETEGKALTGLKYGGGIELLEKLTNQYPNTNIILTLGDKGAYFSQGKKQYFQPSFEVEVVDTTGSGDTFCGYFLAEIVAGHTIEKAMEIASKAASICVTRKGAAASVPYRNEL